MRMFVLMVIFLPSVVWAHAIGADARLKDGRVHIESYYDDNTSVSDATVLVVAEGREVASGKTDGEGRWSFPTPAPGKYRVTIDAGAGHRVTISVTVPTGVPTSDETPAPVGRQREEFTKFPWMGLTIGLGALGAIAVLWSRKSIAK